MNKRALSQLSFCAALASLALPLLKAESPLAFHGSVSATAAISDEYNYLGDTKDSLDLVSAEITLNTAYRLPYGFRFMGQLYAYRLEGDNDLMIDFANIDWQYNEHFGCRAGYVKVPFGLYNEVLDLDSVRPFAFLPTVTYPKAYRPITNNTLSVNPYGMIDLGKAGSLELSAYVGTKDSATGTNSPFLKNLDAGDMMGYDKIDFKLTCGGSVIWNTPLEGLRAVFSYVTMPDIEITGHIRSQADAMVQPNATLSYLPPLVSWDANMAGHPATTKLDYNTWRTGLEYTWKDFTFAAEYSRINSSGTRTYTVSPANSVVTIPAATYSDNFYGMVTWQATKQIGAGVYYGESFNDLNDRHPDDNIFLPGHTGYTKDLAVALSYAPVPWWIFKVENHFFSGTGNLHNSNNWNGLPHNWTKNWNYFVLKSTITF